MMVKEIVFPQDTAHRKSWLWRLLCAIGAGFLAFWGLKDKIWILCPTCHALLDRKHYTPEQLNLKGGD
jgi:hypothetical protein